MKTFVVQWHGTQVFTSFPIAHRGYLRDTVRQEGSVGRIGVQFGSSRAERFFRGVFCVRNRGRDPDVVRIFQKITKHQLIRNRTEARQISGIQDPIGLTKSQIFSKIDELEERQTELEVGREGAPLTTVNTRAHVAKLRAFKTNLLQAAKVVANGNYTIRNLSRTLVVSEARAKLLIRTIQNQPVHKLRQIDAKILQLHRADNMVKNFFSAFCMRDEAIKKTLRQLFENFRIQIDVEEEVSFTRFRTILLELGLRYRSIKYLPKLKYTTPQSVSRAFLATMLHLFVREDLFELLFIDESSIVPENFKKKAWFLRGSQAIVRTKIRYERISLFAAISRKKLISLQFLQSGHSSACFAHFVSETLDALHAQIDTNRRVVIILDNATIHHSKVLLDISRQANCVLFFLLPSVPELTPIELFWEYLKRPLRSMTTYAKFSHQKTRHPFDPEGPGQWDFSRSHPLNLPPDPH